MIEFFVSIDMLNNYQKLNYKDHKNNIKEGEYRCINCRRDFDKDTVQQFLDRSRNKKGLTKRRPICPICQCYLKSKIYIWNKQKFTG